VDERTQSLLDGITAALVVVDADLAVVAWNRAMEWVTGVARAEALGRKADAGLPVLRDPELVARLREAAAGGEPATLEVLHAVPEDERPLWLEVHCVPWRDEAGRVVGGLGVLVDISERHRRELFLRAIEAIGHSLASSLDLDEVLDTIVTKAREVMGAEAALVVAWDGVAPAFSVMRAVGRLSREYAGAGSIPAGGGPVARAIREARPVATRNILTDPNVWLAPERRAQVAREGYKAAAAAPLAAKGRVHGALVVHYWEERTFGDEELAALKLLAEQASLAIQNAQIYGQAERRRAVAEVLARLARELTASLDVERIAELLARGVVEFMGARVAVVFRYESEDGSLHALAAAGDDAEAIRGVVLGAGEGVAGRAVAERATVLARDIRSDPDVRLSAAVRERLKEAASRAAIGVPLLTHERVIGALALGADEDRVFTPDEVRALEGLADQAALAFENARLYATARDSVVRLRDTQAQLVQAAKMSALGQLVSGVAHELNNPLSVIIGYGQLLLGRDLPEVVKRPVELMVSQADRMAKIVRNLLFFSRQRPPERVGVDLNEVLDRTLALRAIQLTLSGIVVEKDLAAELPPVSGDPHQLEQVFLNLVLNAEQAVLETQRGGRILLRTRVAEEGHAVEAQVVDDGPGIPAEALPHVFEPFFTTKTVGTGTGLGLSVSYGIVQEHGGRLTVESRPGETVFTLVLPVLRPAEALAPEPPVVLMPIKGEGRVALVVEDEPSVRDLVVTLLHQTGWNVDVASGGREALERVRGRRYDLVVSDMRMAEGGGEEFYRSAVARDATLRPRFLFITGDTANRGAWSFLDDAGVPVIEKPFQPALFLDVVRRVTTSLTPSTSRE
jgi:PAS domain S-box-containing protein